MGSSRMSAVGFLACIFCFLMPFFTVSCAGQKFMQFSGTQLAFGTTIDQPQIFGPTKKQHVDPNPMATVAFVCAVAGFLMSLLRRGFPLATGITGLAGAFFLLLMRSHIDGEVMQRGAGMITIASDPGYVITVLLFAGMGVWNLYLLWSAGQGKAAPAASPPISPPPPPVV
jgi:hypothetical protein